jgi:hypothetical protein
MSPSRSILRSAIDGNRAAAALVPPRFFPFNGTLSPPNREDGNVISVFLTAQDGRHPAQQRMNPVPFLSRRMIHED